MHFIQLVCYQNQNLILIFGQNSNCAKLLYFNILSQFGLLNKTVLSITTKKEEKRKRKKKIEGGFDFQ